MVVACMIMGRGERYSGFWWGNGRERGYLGKRGADGRIILKWIFKKWELVLWSGLIWFRIGTVFWHL